MRKIMARDKSHILRCIDGFSFSALSAENEKYSFFSLRSLRLKRACERAVIFIFLLLLPISTTTQANDTYPMFQSMVIDPSFHDALIQDREFMKKGGAKVFAMNDGSCLLIGIAKTFPDGGSPETILRAKREGEILARAEILSFSGDIQISTSRVAKTGSLQTEKTNGTVSLSSFLQITETKVEGIIRQLPIVGTWWSEDNRTLYVAVGKRIQGGSGKDRVNLRPNHKLSGVMLDIEGEEPFISILRLIPALCINGGIKGVNMSDGRKVILAVNSAPLGNSVTVASRIAQIKAVRDLLGYQQGVEVISMERLSDREALRVSSMGQEYIQLSEFLSRNQEKVKGFIKSMPIVAMWKDAGERTLNVAIGKIIN
jgi:hypothetical protein